MIDIRGIDNVLLPVGDLDEAVRFYAGALGLPLVFRFDGPGIALFRLGTEPPGLLVRRDDQAGAGKEHDRAGARPHELEMARDPLAIDLVQC